MKLVEKNIFSILLFIIILVGIYLSYIGGYGSDEDTIPMIGVYSNFLNGNFMTSRFTGNPVAEFGIGFLALNFGSFVVNLVTFFLFLSALIVIVYLYFNKDFQTGLVFIVLALSNPYLFFENLEPIDYAWALFFFTLGLHFRNLKKLDLSLIFFAISIGTRINFVPFVFAAIFLFNNDSKFTFKKLTHFIGIIFVSGLFYLPVWIQHGLGLDWLTAGRPDSDLLSYLSRFTYKTILSVGIMQVLFVLYVFINLDKKNFKIIKNYKFEIALILFNLLIFLWIPAEISYLQPGLVFFYLIISKLFPKKYIYTLILLNLITWFININVLKIHYLNKSWCSPTVATNAEIDLKIKKGYIFDFLENRSKIECFIENFSDEYKEKVRSGSPLSE
ncbi:hypothetical protein [Candidatus Pelagibacter sp. HIMB1542]|uniref:hypothetical protein n=1 Tax=Candidatus Pelagibacter sp. HIMB1542 TaxID=3413346 RepID=UPI003F869F25